VHKDDYAPSGPKLGNNPPTVVVLDNFRGDYEDFNGRAGGPAHGEISASAAEQNGFNVIRLQYKDDVSKVLAQINRDIDSGKLPKLGRGDVLNMSFANGIAFSDISFKDASDMLGVKITPDNLADKEVQKKIISALGRLAAHGKDPKKAKAAEETLAELREIKKLQGRSIEVIAAAGNHGPDHFDLSIIGVDERLSALGLDGKPAAFSARNSTTKDTKGVYEVKYNPWTPLLDWPVSYQTDRPEWTLEGTNVHFYDYADNTRIRNISEIKPDGTVVEAKDPKPIQLHFPNLYGAQPSPNDSGILAPHIVKTTEEPSIYPKEQRYPSFAPYNYFQKTDTTPSVPTATVVSAPQLFEGITNWTIAGTSFGDIEELERQKAQLFAMKAGQ
jgi:hypothetical protein